MGSGNGRINPQYNPGLSPGCLLDARRPAWINDLQGVWLESGVFIGSPGRLSVDQALARLAEEV
jgi:hypothetical protein